MSFPPPPPPPPPPLILVTLYTDWYEPFKYRLGDRHGENLSFEEGTGGILHVDFNCLFDKVSHLETVM